MEYYKQVKILGLTAGQRLDLNDKKFNHKAILISRSSGTPVKIFLNSNENISGLTYAFVMSTVNTGSLTSNTGSSSFNINNIIDSILPIRMAAVETHGTGGNGLVFLFN